MRSTSVSEIRLGAFKSHVAQRFALEPLTLLVGKNASGKSNALDAISLLALLAEERDVTDLERGDQEVAGLRGGLTGAAPFEQSHVKVGCTVEWKQGNRIHLDLELDATQNQELVRERLRLQRPGKKTLDLIDCERRAPGSGISDAHVYSGGAPRAYQLLSGRLGTVQAQTKVPQDTKARTLVVDACRAVVSTLRGVLVLDPVPAQMREYARIDTPPHRLGTTVSALVYRLRKDPDAWSRLLELVRGLVEVEVADITFSEGRLPGQGPADVMVALVERTGSREVTIPARLMSDGTLRYLAIVSSLLELGLDTTDADAADDTGRSLVVEEIENSLFPSQGAQVLDLLRGEAEARGVDMVATTHSPALLDALKPDDHDGVVICDRDDEGHTRMQRLVDHPRYVQIAGGGAVGREITRGGLEAPSAGGKSLADVFGP